MAIGVSFLEIDVEPRIWDSNYTLWRFGLCLPSMIRTPKPAFKLKVGANSFARNHWGVDHINVPRLPLQSYLCSIPQSPLCTSKLQTLCDASTIPEKPRRSLFSPHITKAQSRKPPGNCNHIPIGDTCELHVVKTQNHNKNDNKALCEYG